MKIKGPPIVPRPLSGRVSLTRLVDEFMPAYNGARLREACQLLTGKILKPRVTVGLALSGALTPAGLGTSVLAPLIGAGFVDYIVSTGANIYHDLHYSLGLKLHQSRPAADDTELRERKLVRIYDIVFDQEVLFATDRECKRMLASGAPAGRISSAELHYHLGARAAAAEKRNGRAHPGLLSAAWRAGVPVYTSSPGDSTIGMNLAALALEEGPDSVPLVDVTADVNETAAIVYAATRGRKKSAVLILGGGSPKNFLLQTEPHIQEILGLPGRGHDYFIQVTDARPDSGGLSGATPSEAVSWGKVDPRCLPDAVVCYADTTLALPVLAAYCLAKARRRPKRRLFEKRATLLKQLHEAHARAEAQGGQGAH